MFNKPVDTMNTAATLTKIKYISYRRKVWNESQIVNWIPIWDTSKL